MAAVKKTRNQNGYGEKMQVKIITVDKEKRRVEASTRDGAMIYIAIWETSTVFRWPEVGETWTVRKDTGVWKLDQLVQNELAEVESEAVPKTLEELPEGDTRILGQIVHMNAISLGERPKVTGATGGNAALKSLIKALDQLGFIIDETT